VLRPMEPLAPRIAIRFGAPCVFIPTPRT
jgi:hypothetical protein